MLKIYQAKIYYGDQLGGKKQNLDNLKAGALDMAQICSSYHPGKNQALTVLNLPFLPIKNPDVQAIIAADGRVLHRNVVRLIDIVKTNGVLKFAINIKPVDPSTLP